MLYGCALLYLATQFIRPAEIIPGLAGVPLVIGMAALSGAAAGVSLLLRPRNIAAARADKYVLAFWGAVTISNVASGWFGGALVAWVDFLPTVFCYFLLRAAVEHDWQVRGMVRLLIALVFVQAVNGIVQYHTGVGLGGVATVGDGRIQGTGIFQDPNDLGMALVIVVPFLASAVLTRGDWVRPRVLAAALAVPVLVAIVYTNSRGSVLALATIVALSLHQRFGRITATVLGAVLVAGLLLGGPSRAQELDAGESSAQGRIEAWAEGLAMLKSHPLFGVGYGRFTDYHSLVAHNSFVHAAAELGLVGAFCFVGVFYAHFGGLSAAGRRLRDDPRAARSCRDFRNSATGALVCAFFLSRQYVVPLYVVVALGASLERMTAPVADGPRSAPFHLAGVAATTIVATAAVYVMVRSLGAW